MSDTQVHKTYKSQSAQDARRMKYGAAAYWDYLEQHAEELAAKGVADAFTRTLAESLKGNEGD